MICFTVCSKFEKVLNDSIYYGIRLCAQQSCVNLFLHPTLEYRTKYYFHFLPFQPSLHLPIRSSILSPQFLMNMFFYFILIYIACAAAFTPLNFEPSSTQNLTVAYESTGALNGILVAEGGTIHPTIPKIPN